MVNVKSMVYEALKPLTGDVSDSWPSDWQQAAPRIIYTEEENKSWERSGKKTTKSYVRFKVDIFCYQSSTSELACRVDKALAFDNDDGSGLGMTRTFCGDDNGAEWKHKVMRYEAIVDEYSKTFYGIS
jgi:hypothetical protein